MKTVNISEIRGLNPCYDPTKFLSEDWIGTPIDILNVENCPKEDRIWIITTNLFMNDRELRLFAVWCARQALLIPGCESEICSETCNVAERFAEGNATIGELEAAWRAAREAAFGAACGAACGAAWRAAREAARGAAWGAAREAAREATRGAARGAAWRAAREAARGAARGATRGAQIERLKNHFNVKEKF